MKTAFLISGFNMNQCAADEKYKDLRDAIASKEYRVMPAPIFWNHKTVAQYCAEFIEFYRKNKSGHNIVIGGSYGAMVAFLTAPVLKPDRVFACSLSPYFVEDLDKTTEKYRIEKFGIKRNRAQKNLSAKDTAKQINKTKTEVTLLYGEKEKQLYPYLVKRVLETATDLKNTDVIEVSKTGHIFRDPLYIEAIKNNL